MTLNGHTEAWLLAGLVLACALVLGCNAGDDWRTADTEDETPGGPSRYGRDAGVVQDGSGGAVADGPVTVVPDASDSDGGDDLGNGDLGDGVDAAEFWTIAVLPDTQSSYYFPPSFFAAETQWIADNRDSEGIAFVLHEGDIVDTPWDTNQWAAARANLGLLDGKVPYVLAAGNHDLGSTAGEPRSTLVNQYFSFDVLVQTSTFGGAFESGHRENAYYLMPGGGRTWIVIALEFSPRPEVVNWADQVLTQYPDLPAIIVTHAYLYSDGQRYNHVGRACQFSGDCTSLTPPGSNPQCWNPICYLGDGTDGEMLWNSLVKSHSNIVFVFSGHVANAAPFDAARLSSTRPDGTVCHQLMADFQADGATGGDGYFRLLRIWRDGRVQVRTFSPYVDPAKAFWTDDRNQFDLQIQIPGG